MKNEPATGTHDATVGEVGLSAQIALSFHDIVVPNLETVKLTSNLETWL